MRVLVIGNVKSMHMVRYLRMMSTSDIELHAFHVGDIPVAMPDVGDVTLHHTAGIRPASLDVGRWRPIGAPLRTGVWPVLTEESSVARVIRDARPDVVHAQGLRDASIVACGARVHMGEEFPPFLVSGWGQDIAAESPDPLWRLMVRTTLRLCDAFTAECARFLPLARRLGFRGLLIDARPIAGGFVLDDTLDQPAVRPSLRRSIAVKGYRNNWGRGDVALAALERCGALLAGYTLELYLPGPGIEDLARALCERNGMALRVHVRVPYEDILSMHARSRVSIGLSMFDGISTSFLEAMMMGAFPVQSFTGCAQEWAQQDVGALFVEPEHPEGVAASVARALTDDELVDRAAEVNARTVRARLHIDTIREAYVDTYRRVAAIRSVA